jgi:hypothetical protein
VADDQPDPNGESGEDLEYDLAHEAAWESAKNSPISDEPRAAVLPEMPTDDGDYSYDLAHDIPRT